MSTLVVHIPQRRRLRSRNSAGLEADASAIGTEYVYVTSPDGLVLQSQGQCAASLLPKAATVIAVLSDADVSWHRITLPKAPAARLRAALSGVLEDALLEDPADVHLAIAPQSGAGQPTWVAAVSRPWLRGEIALLEKAEVFIDRIVPMAWPDDPPIGHFAEQHIEDGASTESIELNWSDADGVASMNLQGGLARSLVPSPAPPGTRWSTTPGAAAAAEKWLGAPVNVFPPGHRMLQATRTLWNLRQFDLARRTRGARALRDSLRKLLSPEWRPVRYGLGALVLAQIVGLNLWAWHQQSAIAAKRMAMQNLVKAAFPKVSELDIQRDAATVMQRETTALRVLAGRPSDTDLESLLQAASSAWPAERPATDNLRFEPGKLTLSAGGWNDGQIEQFRSVLRPGGWLVEVREGRLTLTRARVGDPS